MSQITGSRGSLLAAEAIRLRDCISKLWGRRLGPPSPAVEVLRRKEPCSCKAHWISARPALSVIKSSELQRPQVQRNFTRKPKQTPSSFLARKKGLHSSFLLCLTAYKKHQPKRLKSVKHVSETEPLRFFGTYESFYPQPASVLSRKKTVPK